jgi:predicted site-specific integrase-resolvase
MTIVSRKEAMALTGKSHATLYRHLKSGKLSKSPDGGIDTAELIRVYGEFVSPDAEDTSKTIKNDISALYQKDKSDTEIKLMQEQIDLLKSQLTDTKSQLVRSQEKEDKLLQLIENRLPPPDDNNSVVERLKKKFL